MEGRLPGGTAALLGKAAAAEPLSAVAQAAWLVEDAMLGAAVRDTTHETAASRRFYRQYWKVVQPGQTYALVALVLLSFLEMPLWCISNAPIFDYLDPAQACTAGPNRRLFLSGVLYLPPGVAIIAELGVCICMIVLAALENRWRPAFAQRPEQRARTLIVVAMIIDTLAFAALLATAKGEQVLRLAPYLRFVLLMLTPLAAPAVASTIALFKAFIPVLFLLFVVVLTGALYMAMLLDDVNEEQPACRGLSEAWSEYQGECDTIDTGFQTFQESIFTMFITSSTVDVPGQMVPSYTWQRPIGLLWLVFYLLADLLILNVVLATVYNEYSGRLKAKTVTFFKRRCRGLTRAFKTLAMAEADARHPPSSTNFLRAPVTSFESGGAPGAFLRSRTRPLVAAHALMAAAPAAAAAAAASINGSGDADGSGGGNGTGDGDVGTQDSASTVGHRFEAVPPRPRVPGIAAFHSPAHTPAPASINASGGAHGSSRDTGGSASAPPAALHVTIDQFEGMIHELNKVDIVPYFPPHHVRFLFNTLDDDNSGTLSLEEFHDVCDVLHFSFKRMRTQSWVERHWPHVWDDLCLGALRRWVKQESGLSFTRLETTTMVANSIVVFVEAIVDLNNLPGQNGFGWGLADFGFSVAYVAFTAAKLTVIPLEKYLLSYANRFDLIVTLVLGVVALLWILPRPVLDNATLRYFTLLRLLRLIQLMGDVPSFAFIFDCIASMIVGSAGVLLLVFSSTGLWAVAGVQIFGGKMYRDVEVPEDSVPPPDADLFTSNYDVFVPNDLSVAFMPLFSMLVSGGPITEIISGSAYAIDAGCDTCGLWLSRLYWLSFYIVSLLAVYNIFTSFVLDAFMARFELQASQTADGASLAEPSSSNGVDEHLESLRKAYNEPGFEVVANVSHGADNLLKQMFADELSEILEQELASLDAEDGDVPARTGRERSPFQIAE